MSEGHKDILAGSAATAVLVPFILGAIYQYAGTLVTYPYTSLAIALIVTAALVIALSSLTGGQSRQQERSLAVAESERERY